MRPASTVTAALAAALSLTAAAPAAEKENRVYELRVYTAAKGKFDALHARFRDHTVKLFEKHGMTNVGYWVPTDPADERLFYVLGHADRQAAAASWKAFMADPDWQAAYKASEKDGRLVAKLDAFYLSPTDYSPPVKAGTGDGERVFELRTYIATPNNLTALNSRFRDHTLKLFEKHGLTNVAYWTLADGEKATVGKLLAAFAPPGQGKADTDLAAPAAPAALVYMLAHKSADVRDKSFDEFRKDPDWVKARTESETKAGGSLTVKDGVKSIMLKPTDYSPLK